MDKTKNSIIKNITDFICKDTSGKNESKKVIVIVRILIISCIFYFTVNAILCDVAFGNTQILVFYSLFLLLFLGLLAISYYFSTKVTLWWFIASMIAWILSSLHYFGWDIGVQHFLLLLLVLYCFSSYKNYASKVLFSVGMCALRIVLFYIYHKKDPVLEITSMDGNVLQILNTITIFFCISVIAFICSKDSQELEGKLVEYNNQLKRQANTDALTGLYNRRKAISYIEEVVARSTNGFSLCICDIDFFKRVNDNYGHDFGDKVLESISSIFLEEMQGKNMASRWGGEEFLLLFPDCNGDEALIKLEQIKKRIKDTAIELNGQKISVTLTYGLAEYNFSGEIDDTIKEADKKLYAGKQKGRDIIIF